MLRRWTILGALVGLVAAACGGGGANCTPARACSLKELAREAHLRVGVAAAPSEDERYNRLVAREFSALALEGELLWQVVHPERDRWEFAAADHTLAFAKEHGLPTTATHFLWDQAFNSVPDWVKAIDDPVELRTVLRDHLSTITERYGGDIDRWIVVNEPFDYTSDLLYQNHFYRVLGPGYIGEAFRIAKEAAPDAELWLNEVLTEYKAPTAAALVELAASLVADGVPIDGVGLQGHLFLGDPDFDLVESTMREIGDLGLKVAITELDAPVAHDLRDRLSVQGARTARMVEVCLIVPACESVTWWGVHDGVSWLNWFLEPGLDPLLFDASLNPKPAYDAVRDALARGRPARSE